MSMQKTAGWRWAAVNEIGQTIGQFRHRARLTDEQVERVRLMRQAGKSYRKIAAELRISKSQALRICHYRQRSQTTMGHRRVPLPRDHPADPGEFE